LPLSARFRAENHVAIYQVTSMPMVMRALEPREASLALPSTPKGIVRGTPLIDLGAALKVTF
jgi:hypothetical protein